MTEEQVNALLEDNKKLHARVAFLEGELQVQRDLVAALLKKLYGAQSEKLSPDQLLMAFLEDESKKHPKGHFTRSRRRRPRGRTGG